MRKTLATMGALSAVAAAAGCFSSSESTSAGPVFDSGFGDITIPNDGEAPDVTTEAPPEPEASVDSSSPGMPDTSMAAPDTSTGAVDSSMPTAPDASVDATPEASAPEAGPVDAAPEAMGDGNTCGTGVISGSEVCSGTNLNGATCRTVVGATTGGTLACSANCLSFDTSGCTCASAGYTACVAPNNGCFDLQTDANNCGTCGNACGAGNPCSLGRCTSVLMGNAPAQMQVLGLAIDGTNAYFINTFDYQLYSVPLSGGTPHAMLTSVIPGNGNYLTVLGGNVYWTQFFNGVYSVPVTGGAAVPISTSEPYPNTIANDGTNIFWANTASTYDIRQDVVATSTVSTVPIATPDAGPGLSGLYFFAVDANHLYWGDYIGSGTTDVYQANKDGSNVIVLASGYAGSVNGLTVDANNVYFTVAPGPNGVFQVPIGGGTVTTLASGQSLTSYAPLVTDGQNVYWMAGGVVRKTPVGGGPITNLASCATIDSTAPCGGQYDSMAIDSTYVYWTDESEVLSGGSGTLFKTLK